MVVLFLRPILGLSDFFLHGPCSPRVHFISIS